MSSISIFNALQKVSLLQTNPKEKAVILCETFLVHRSFTEAIGHALFKSFGVKSVYFFLGNVLPIYTRGQDTGIVIELGY